MNDIQKFLQDGQSVNSLNVNIPVDIQKSDGDHKRIVVGFATLDNIDRTGEVITNEASAKAFGEFRGNVRLMHDKMRPVGKVIDYQPAVFFDKETQKEYQGVQVAVQISEGADDVWKMCVDRTLSGFSVGGKVRKMNTEYREDIDKTVQVIEEYFLEELSLVDSPANQLSNIHTIYKSVDGGSNEAKVNMHMGFTKVFEIETKGETPMPEENVTTEPAKVEEAPVAPEAETPKVEETVEPVSTPADEAPKDETKKAPTLEEVIEALSAKISESNESITKNVSDSVSVQLETIEKGFNERFTGLSDVQKALDSKFESISEKVNALETSTQKSLTEISANTALQKSIDAPATNLQPTEDEPFAGLFSNKYES